MTKLRFSIAMLLAAFLLAGCGGSGSSTAVAPTPEPPPPPPTFNVALPDGHGLSAGETTLPHGDTVVGNTTITCPNTDGCTLTVSVDSVTGVYMATATGGMVTVAVAAPPPPVDHGPALAEARTAANQAESDARAEWQAARAALLEITGMQSYNPVAYAQAMAALSDAETAYDAAKAAAAAAAATMDVAEARRQQALAEDAQDDAEAANTTAMASVQQVKDVPAARTAAAAAAKAAKDAYDAAVKAVAAVEGKKADDKASYDMAAKAQKDAKDAYDAAMAASTAANSATTSATAKAAQTTAEAEKTKAEAAQADAMKYAGMVDSSYQTAEKLRTSLETAQMSASSAAAKAMEARDEAQGEVAGLEDKKADDIPNYTRAMDALATANTAYAAAKAASDAAANAPATTEGLAEARRQEQIAIDKRGEVEAAKMEVVKYAGLVVASYEAADRVRQDAKDEATKLATARTGASSAATEARAHATAARKAANDAADALGADSLLAIDADAAADVAEDAATAAEAAAAAAAEDTKSGDAEQEQRVAESKRDEAKMKLAEANTLRRDALIAKESSDRALIVTYREQASDAKTDAMRHAASARSKATLARQAATDARTAANRAKAAMTDYVEADKQATKAEEAATAAETAATAAETAATAAETESDKTKADGVTVGDALAARDAARSQRDIAMANDTGDEGANAQYMLAKEALGEAVKYAGMPALKLLKTANAEHMSGSARTAAIKRVNMAIGAQASDSEGDDSPNSASDTGVAVTWPYTDLGADNSVGGTGANADGKAGEGMIGIVVTSPALTLTRDNPSTPSTNETNFTTLAALGEFNGFEIASAATASTQGTQVLVFTDKEQGAAAKPESSASVSGVTAVASRIRLPDNGTAITDANGYDHDGDGKNYLTSNVSITCPSNTTCSVTINGGKVTYISGYVVSASGTISAVAQAEDDTYLAFGVWLTETAGETRSYTFGAFDGGGSANLTVQTALTGTATYSGSAAGVRSTSSGVDFFSGDATLTAKFGEPGTATNPTATDDEAGTISGRIHNVVAGGESVSGDILLHSAAISNTENGNGAFNGSTGMGTATVEGTTVKYPLNGTWAGRFYNPVEDDPATTGVNETNTTPPDSVAGTFGVTRPDVASTTDVDESMSFVGAFGAHK